MKKIHVLKLKNKIKRKYNFVQFFLFCKHLQSPGYWKICESVYLLLHVIGFVFLFLHLSFSLWFFLKHPPFYCLSIWFLLLSWFSLFLPHKKCCSKQTCIVFWKYKVSCRLGRQGQDADYSLTLFLSGRHFWLPRPRPYSLRWHSSFLNLGLLPLTGTHQLPSSCPLKACMLSLLIPGVGSLQLWHHGTELEKLFLSLTLNLKRAPQGDSPSWASDDVFSPDLRWRIYWLLLRNSK